MTEFKPIKEGKVREIYDNGDSLIMVFEQIQCGECGSASQWVAGIGM